MGNKIHPNGEPQSPEHAKLSIDQLGLLFDKWPHAAFAIDRHGVFIYQNDVDRIAFGDLVGRTALEIKDQKVDAENWIEVHKRVLSGETVSMVIQDLNQDPSTRDADVTLAPIWDGGHVIAILGMTINRNDAWRLKREMEAAAKEAEASKARLQRLTDNVPGGIFEFMIDGTGKQAFPYVNSGMGPLLGTTTEAILKDPIAAFANDHPDDANAVNQAVSNSFHTLEPVNITHRINHPTLGVRWNRVQATPRRMTNGGVIWHGCIFDVTEEQARAQELEKARNRMATLSLFDTLTGLPNRRACEDEYARRFADPDARLATTTVIRIDLDHFKAVNDTLGHEAGDAVLCRVAACMNDVACAADFNARLGGDEFVMILAPGKTLKNAEEMIQQLRDQIAVPFYHEGRHCHFDASFGVACTDTLPDDFASLLSAADAALLQAKDRGRGRMSIFTPELKREILHSRKRGAEIKLALERNEFVPYFQPQIDAASGDFAGFEVLARWHHPVEGCLLPIEFIPFAEQMRTVQDIDRMMFEKALDILSGIQGEGLHIPKLAFNVSAARVHDPDIIGSVRQLQTQGTRVAFELLESILLEDETALFAHHIDMLKDLDIEIEVDDFGSGRASVIGVQKVAPHALKLDRQLVLPMFENEMANNLLKAMVDIGRSLGVSVIAEGVETMDHARALRDLGCHTLQGYAFGRPMPEADIRDFLASSSSTQWDRAGQRP